MNETRRLKIADMTLKTGDALRFKEKVQIARLLDHLHMDVIELDTIDPTREKADALLVSTIGSFAKACVVSLGVGMTEASIDTAWNAVSRTQKPRLRIELPVSVVQMEYMSHKKPPKMLELIRTLVAKAHTLCPDVEFCALDATRGEEEFLHEAIATAIAAGASTVTVCDDAGAMLPEAFGAWIGQLYSEIPVLHDVTLGVCAVSDYGLAQANMVEAVKAGAGEIKAVVGDEKRAATDVVCALVSRHGDALGVQIGVDQTCLHRCVQQIGWILDPKKAGGLVQAGEIESAQDHAMRLSAGDDFDTVIAAAAKIGYDLSDEDKGKVYEEFCRAAEKKAVGSRELDAIIANVALQVPPTYRLVSYAIHTGNEDESSAQIKLERQGTTISDICLGDGPIDAAFTTIERIVGHHYELDDFQVQAITEGRDSLGGAVVKLRDNGRLYAGNGISTDIIGASIRAYLSALNKIVYEENNA